MSDISILFDRDFSGNIENVLTRDMFSTNINIITKQQVNITGDCNLPAGHNYMIDNVPVYYTGPTGYTGAPGSATATGATGPTGFTGPEGPAGVGFTGTNIWSSLTGTFVIPASSISADTYFIGDLVVYANNFSGYLGIYSVVVNKSNANVTTTATSSNSNFTLFTLGYAGSNIIANVSPNARFKWNFM